METQIKFIGEDSKYVIYGYETEYDKMYFHFDKELNTVEISYARFVLRYEDSDWTIQEESLKYSCKYGYWQAETSIGIHTKCINNDRKNKSMWGRRNEFNLKTKCKYYEKNI